MNFADAQWITFYFWHILSAVIPTIGVIYFVIIFFRWITGR